MNFFIYIKCYGQIANNHLAIKRTRFFMVTMLLFLQLSLIGQNAASTINGREQLSLNKGWRFFQGDIAFPEIKGHGMSYGNAKAGKSWGAAAPDFDDSEWRILNLPHDWAVEQPFDSTANLSQGYRKRGYGWYRRNFKLSTSDKGKYLELQFEGIATHCTVWFNGTLVNRNFCGYNSFTIDITPFAYYGNELNNIVVRVDAVQQEGWWYEGAGIYRNTWLIKTAPTHIITDGVFAQPIHQTGSTWIIPAEITLENAGKQSTEVQVLVELLHASGKKITQQNVTANVSNLSRKLATLKLEITNPELWTLENPILYQIKTTVLEQGKIVDQFMSSCGFRTIKFTPDKGFLLNGKSVKIKGVCNHQDHAGVGVAVPDAIWDFRLRRLKEMGANAYRCAHNPPSASFLDACDRNGILVMDENRNFNVSPEYTRQLEWLVRRDRNHPSVILWSVFNEEPMQGTENGYELVRRMSAIVKSLDTTRPVTAAASGGLLTSKNVAHAVDVIGMNYQTGNYDKVHEAFPNIPITSSEDVSGLMVRGEYVTDRKRFVHSSYDTQFPSWGTSHRVGWKKVDERPFLAGCFIWTGFDYRGEPQPYEWPAAGASFGIMDQCGFPKSAFYLHQAQWTSQPVLQLIPHWNWPVDSIGKPIKVMAFTNADKVKLFLNGKLITEKLVDKYEMVEWTVPYTPGKLQAIGYKDNQEFAQHIVETTGLPVRLQLIPDRKTMVGDGYDAVPVTVQALDAKGRPVPTANIDIDFELSGSGNIIGLGNGNPNSHESEKGNHRKLFNGLAQVILQSHFNGKGPLVLKASSLGLMSAELTMAINEVPQIPFVETIEHQLILNQWRVSPVFDSKPDQHVEPAKTDMNSWGNAKTASQFTLKENGFMVFKTSFKPYRAQQKNGGQIIIKGISNKAEIWLDDEKLLEKNQTQLENLSIPFPAKEGERKITIIMEGVKTVKFSLGEQVLITSKN